MDPTRRRCPKARPCAEVLESRSLLTGGAGNTFALFPATIATPGGTAAVKVTIDPAHFTRPNGKLTLGIDVVAATGETVTPRIIGVLGPNGLPITKVTRSSYDSHVKLSPADRGNGTRAVLIPADANPQDPNQAQTFTVQVAGLNNTAGKALVGFYLPGDANGDGLVDQSDIKAIAAAKGSHATQSSYSFDIDSNRDGRIGANDLAVAQRNLGDKVNILPMLSANLDPATDSDPQNRITNVHTVHFTGQVSAGATLTYSEVSGKTPTVTTTAGADGNYSLLIPLATGVNTFHVSSTDAFGQTISGQIASVTYNPNAPVVHQAATTTTTTTTTTPPATTAQTSTKPATVATTNASTTSSAHRARVQAARTPRVK